MVQPGLWRWCAWGVHSTSGTTGHRSGTGRQGPRQTIRHEEGGAKIFSVPGAMCAFGLKATSQAHRRMVQTDFQQP